MHMNIDGSDVSGKWPKGQQRWNFDCISSILVDQSEHFQLGTIQKLNFNSFFESLSLTKLPFV